MRIKKLFDGVYEFPSFKPEPLNQDSMQSTYEQLNEVAVGLGREYEAKARGTNHVLNENSGVRGASAARDWHIDLVEKNGRNCGLLEANDCPFMLILVACDDPKLGTEIRRGEDSVFTCKTWTPYLVRWDVVHRGPQVEWTEPRLLLRTGVKIDESKLDARASTVYKVAA